MTSQGAWDDKREDELQESLRQQINQAVKDAETAGPPELDSLFDDVYAARTSQLEEQRKARGPSHAT
jgi:2-oxoisovalerate dehydrogenase E1 component alpha subunit